MARKRLIKKSDQHSSVPFELNEFKDDGELGDFADSGSPPTEYDRGQPDYDPSSRKRKSNGGLELKHGDDKRYKRKNHGSSCSNSEIKEMWDRVGGDSEEDKDCVRTLDEGDKDCEIEQFFKMGKKKKIEKSADEIALMVEQVIAEFEVAAEDDAVLNSEGKPAFSKLRKLPLLTEALSKKQLQHEFLERGVLTSLKAWLEPLPDGSLPNINIREAILRILTDFPLHLEQEDEREYLKKSGLGKVIMFLSRSNEETPSNRKLAKDLVDKWSRPMFNKSIRFGDLRYGDDVRVAQQRASVKKPTNKPSRVNSKDDDLDFHETLEKKSGLSSIRLPVSRPEAMAMDFLIRPQSKIDPEEIRAGAKLQLQHLRRLKINKNLQHLKSAKKKQLQATTVSAEGRGMDRYL